MQQTKNSHSITPSLFSSLMWPQIHHLRWFSKVPSSSFTWASTAIRKASSPEKALFLYSQVHRRGGFRINSYVALLTLKSCARLSHHPSLVPHVHAHLLKIGLGSHVYVATALLQCYVVSSFEDARLLFDEMPERNVVTWNTMITGCSNNSDVELARSLFDSMPVRDLTSWSAMIAGYIGIGNWNQGLELFRKLMANEALKPDQVTLGTVLSACARMRDFGLLGKSIHAYLEKSRFELDVGLGTALVDMYAKCGFLNSASQVFDGMRERNVITWSALICGLALHGHGEQAFFMFGKMREADVRPNEITFTGILNACRHAGLVEEGCKYFDCMIEEFGLEPRIQHYGCMVDLLGKSGKLEEAYEVIKTMRLEPNIAVWTSLLAALKMHNKHFDIAEEVIKRVLLVADPNKNGGVYTLISDLYALNGKWHDVERVRKFMVDKKVKKNRGSSFIETGSHRRSIHDAFWLLAEGGGVG